MRLSLPWEQRASPARLPALPCLEEPELWTWLRVQAALLLWEGGQALDRMWTGQAEGITWCIYRTGQKKPAMEAPRERGMRRTPTQSAAAGQWVWAMPCPFQGLCIARGRVFTPFFHVLKPRYRAAVEVGHLYFYYYRASSRGNQGNLVVGQGWSRSRRVRQRAG